MGRREDCCSRYWEKMRWLLAAFTFSVVSRPCLRLLFQLYSIAILIFRFVLQFRVGIVKAIVENATFSFRKSLDHPMLSNLRISMAISTESKTQFCNLRNTHKPRFHSTRHFKLAWKRNNACSSRSQPVEAMVATAFSANVWHDLVCRLELNDETRGTVLVCRT